MLHIGCHLSSSKGFAAMGRQALELGADTFQFFTRNPRGSRAKELDTADAASLLALLGENHFAPIVAHAPYTLNLCGATAENRRFAQETMADDLRRLEHLPGQYYNFHPGSHVGQGLETGCRQIADMLDQVVSPVLKTTVLLETMAGKGSEIGGKFEDLRAIIDLASCGDRLGVCLDTCHVSDGGYDIAGNLEGVLEEFDKAIGLSRLKAIHINDSMNPLGAHKDRHAKIGEGTLGTDAIVRVITHPSLKHLPFLLETPDDDAGHAAEIAMLRQRIGERSQ